MKGFCVALLSILMLFGFLGYATAQMPAVEIFYDLQDLGSGQWRYDYTVKNNSLGKYTELDQFDSEGIVMFEIYFPARQGITQAEADLFSMLDNPTAPTGWDPLVFQLPSGSLHPPSSVNVWVFNVLADSGNEILIGQTVTGFSVNFHYAGPGSPGAQQFSVLGLATLDEIVGGRTQLYHIPEPATLLLLGASMFAIVLLRRNGS